MCKQMCKFTGQPHQNHAINTIFLGRVSELLYRDLSHLSRYHSNTTLIPLRYYPILS